MATSKLLIITLGVSLSASACATKTGTGTAVGGAAGGALGYAIGGVPGLIVGGVAGGLVGNRIGHKMDETDRERAAVALERNQQMQWSNEQTGDQYRIQPTATREIDGRQCRDYRIDATIDGKPGEISGTACKHHDGTWQSIST